jgi:hypothetical protein
MLMANVEARRYIKKHFDQELEKRLDQKELT